MRLELNQNEGNLGFQIAPMIDVVFVIMLFFMVMAGAVKVENELNTQLPGTAETSNSTDFVDEQIIITARQMVGKRKTFITQKEIFFIRKISSHAHVWHARNSI